MIGPNSALVRFAGSGRVGRRRGARRPRCSAAFNSRASRSRRTATPGFACRITGPPTPTRTSCASTGLRSKLFATASTNFRTEDPDQRAWRSTWTPGCAPRAADTVESIAAPAPSRCGDAHQRRVPCVTRIARANVASSLARAGSEVRPPSGIAPARTPGAIVGIRAAPGAAAQATMTKATRTNALRSIGDRIVCRIAHEANNAVRRPP